MEREFVFIANEIVGGGKQVPPRESVPVNKVAGYYDECTAKGTCLKEEFKSLILKKSNSPHLPICLS